jgi:crotonobetainyl-CoA:carnitine CoA-transferase CaiB-like acyl-CoA transferase
LLKLLPIPSVDLIRFSGREKWVAVPADRRLHRDELKEIIEGTLKNEPADFWLERLRHLPAGKVRSLDDALRAD